MQLDVRTLAIIGSIVAICLSLGFTLLGFVLRRQRVLRIWAAGFWLAALAGILVGLRGVIGVPVSLIGAHAAIAISGAFMLKGVTLHVGRTWRWTKPAAFIAGYLILIGWYAFVQPDLTTRLMLYSLLSVTWDVCMVGTLLRHGQREVRLSYRIGAVIFMLDALCFLMRPFLPYDAAGGQDLMKSGALLVATYAFGIILALARTLAFILLVTERLVVDLGRQARTDGLTGLLNRGALIDEGRRCLSRCQTLGRPMALLMFDLDHFKRINDTWGHEAGDMVLCHFTGIVLPYSERAGGLLGRYGGEEFVLALPGMELVDALALAERLRHAIATTSVRAGPDDIAVTTSIGVALAGSNTYFETLIASADDALYRAKTRGRDCVACSTDETSPVVAVAG
jgi:diguanylate cyclase (GGDEF)-like protein